jgi:hypothetical protein
VENDCCFFLLLVLCTIHMGVSTACFCLVTFDIILQTAFGNGI